MKCRKSLIALVAAGALSVGVIPESAALIATDATYGAFDASSGFRTFVFTDSEVITDVNISIVFSKCDDPLLGPAAQLGDPCIGQSIDFAGETVFRLSHDTTTVNLVSAGTYSSSAPGAGVVAVTFDDGATPVGGPITGGTFSPVSPLSAFNGLNSLGTWNLFIQDTVRLDPLEYFRACIAINGQTGCAPFIGATSGPEPMSLALLAIGLAGLGFARRKAR